MKTACLALVAVLATASAFAPVPSSRVARASPQSRARVVVAEGTYWEGEAPPSKVLGNLAGAPSILLGPASGVFLLIGLYCVASSQIFQVRALSPCWGSGRRLTFFLSPCFAADERVEHEPLLYRGLNLRAGLVGTSRGRLDPEEERVVGLDAVCAVTRGSGRERSRARRPVLSAVYCARARRRPCSPHALRTSAAPGRLPRRVLRCLGSVRRTRLCSRVFLEPEVGAIASARGRRARERTGENTRGGVSRASRTSVSRTRATFPSSRIDGSQHPVEFDATHRQASLLPHDERSDFTSRPR